MPPQTQSAVEKEAERKRKEAAHRKEAIQAGSKAVTKAANKAIKGEDLTTEESVKELVGGLIVTQLPPDAKKAVEAAMKVDYDKVFPKDKNGDRDLSTEGLIRQGLVLLDELGGPEVKKALETRKNALEIAEKFGIDVPTIEEILNTDWDKLLDKLDKGISDISASEAIRGVMSILEKYGGEQIQKALEARKKFLELADKIGLKIPTIEDLIDFDWSTLADKLGSLEFSDIFDIDKLIDYLEGELLSFLPPGSADSLKHIRTMLKEFELPTSLKEVYHSLDDKKKELEAQKPAVPSMPGVFVNGHTIARVGRTFMAHGGVPLTGPAAKTVKADFMPVWCANPSHVHACPAPFLVPPAPDGPAFASKGSTDVMVEFFPVCRHDLDALDIKCTPTNRFLTEALAKAAWKELEKINKPTPEESEKDKKDGGKGSGKPGEDGKEPGDDEKKKDGESGEDKDSPPASTEKVPPIARFEVFDAVTNEKVGGSGAYDALLVGKKYIVKSTSYDPDDGDGSVDDEGITSWSWQISGGASTSGSASSCTFEVEAATTVRMKLTVTDSEGETCVAERSAPARKPTPCEEREEEVKEVAESIETVLTWLGYQGLENGASNLRHWRDGSGTTKSFDAAWMRGYAPVTKAEKENSSAIDQDLFERLKQLGDGETHSIQVLETQTGVQTVYDDLRAAWGTFRIQSTGRFTFQRQGNVLSGSGTVVHRAEDRYDWNPGGRVYFISPVQWSDDKALLLEDCLEPKPRPYDLRSQWSHSVKITGHYPTIDSAVDQWDTLETVWTIEPGVGGETYTGTSRSQKVEAEFVYQLWLFAHEGNWFDDGDFSAAGHLWVGVRKLTEEGEVVQQRCMGFYPIDSPSTGWVFDTPGVVRTTDPFGASYQAGYVIDEVRYAAAQAAASGFQGQNYSAGTNDCVSLGRAVFQAAGYATGTRIMNIYPVAAFNEIVSRNAPDL